MGDFWAMTGSDMIGIPWLNFLLMTLTF